MKASKGFVWILSAVFIAALSLLTVKPAVADHNGVVISAPTGGDCFPPLGTWNALTKTCKLNDDIDLSDVGGDGITIASDGITLLCNGHSITGMDYSGNGILANGRSGVTIKYCNVHNFGNGISLLGSPEQPTNNNTVNNNAVNSNDVGIALFYSNSNTLNNNTVNNNNLNSAGGIPAGIAFFHADSNTVSNNTANSNFVGIFLQDSDSNTVNNNTANLNFVGILLFDADSNTVNNNTANSNFVGIALTVEFDGSNINTVNNNTADGNSLYGFFNDNSSTNNIYKHNECSGNTSGGSDPTGFTGLCSPQP